jgi:hypothetical protein
MIQLSNYSLEDMMNLPLPSIPEQKKLNFRPSYRDVVHVYNQVNEHVFDNELNMPRLLIAPRCRQYWGMCLGDDELHNTGSFCEIRLMDKWFCAQWAVTVIAHEMVHQHQWDIEGPKRWRKGKDFLMSHGPTFFRFRDKLENYGISLKTAHSQRKWFKHQDLFKC